MGYRKYSRALPYKERRSILFTRWLRQHRQRVGRRKTRSEYRLEAVLSKKLKVSNRERRLLEVRVLQRYIREASYYDNTDDIDVLTRQFAVAIGRKPPRCPARPSSPV